MSKSLCNTFVFSFGSYNNPKKNCKRDVLMISATNLFTALYACAVIFSILGFKEQIEMTKTEFYKKYVYSMVLILYGNLEPVASTLRIIGLFEKKIRFVTALDLIINALNS